MLNFCCCWKILLCIVYAYKTLSIFNHFNIHTQQPPNYKKSLFNLSTMFKAMSTKKFHRGYDQLVSDSTTNDHLSEAKLLRSTTLPANFFGDLPVNFVPESKISKKVDIIDKQVKKVSRVHPLFSLFERRSKKKKATATPEFSRYIQYLKEGGFSDANSTKRVLF